MPRAAAWFSGGLITVRAKRVNALGPKAMMMVLLGRAPRPRPDGKSTPLRTGGSYLLSQDGIIDQLAMFSDSRPARLPANGVFLERHPEFEHDRERNERFLLTHHPLGWLRRRT